MDTVAKKSLGQNFLINEGIVDKIIKAAEIEKEDTILEVGPGTGNLTKKIVAKSGKVIAVEKDSRLIEELRNKFPSAEIIEADILEFDPSKFDLKENEYKIIGNLPYYITSHFIRIALARWPRPKLMTLMVQSEVAQRIIAKPPNMNLLALAVQLHSNVTIVAHVSRGSFRPIPKVDSTVINITPKEFTLSPEENSQLFKTMKMGFSEKRKQLAGTLSRKIPSNKENVLEILKKSGIDDKARPENLSLDDWIRLANLIDY